MFQESSILMERPEIVYFLLKNMGGLCEAKFKTHQICPESATMFGGDVRKAF